MKVEVRSLCGIGAVPSHRTSASKWLARQGIRTFRVTGKGGEAEAVQLCDLPEAVRLAWLRHDLDRLRLDPGAYDDAAHEAFAGVSPSRRARAERKAAVARLLVAQLAQGAAKGDAFALARETFGPEGTSNLSLKRVLRAVQGVDPINFAPALLDDYKPTAKRAEMSEDAWRFFMTALRNAAPDWPLKQAWRDVRDVARREGWQWPSYLTVFRRWHELDEAQRLVVRHGTSEAAKRLTQPVHRDKTTILPMEWVSLDGRTLDLWTDFGDGRALRPVMLVLVDVASNMVLGWELAPSENAAATVRLIKNVCACHGIFDRLYTDNGSAFAGHMVAGGNAHRFRNGPAKEGPPQLGICKNMGIELRFALPRNAQAKIAEAR